MLHKLSADLYKDEREFKLGNKITDYDDLGLGQNDVRTPGGDYFVNRYLTQLGIKDVANFAVGDNHLYVVHTDNKLYAYDTNGNRTLIHPDKPIRKLVCEYVRVAFIDIIDDLYVMGEFWCSHCVHVLPSKYTLTPIFIEHDVLDVDVNKNFVF